MSRSSTHQHMQKLITLFFDDELTMRQIEHLLNEPLKWKFGKERLISAGYLLRAFAHQVRKSR